MNKISLLTVFIIVALQSSLLCAKPVETTHKSVVEKLTEDANNVVKSFSDATGFSDVTSQKVMEKIKTDAKKVASSIESFMDIVKKGIEANKPEFQKVVSNVQTHLAKTSDSLKQFVGPNNVKKAEELKASFNKNLEAAMEPIDKVIKAVQPSAQKFRDDLETSGKHVLDSIIDGATKVGKVVKNSVNNVEKSFRE
ncbi:uncharacterized protein LOC123684449 [Harmonia axyridis]|uniref:uncharacterized protein LOC123684449 n=1 Tax=Harmonia axyridis TaxID=115357 RepID=UPI001E2791A9|nr:uncharacterized protein LOC123684449 [Harmonia axyridis]